MKNKKGVQPPTLLILIAGIVVLAILIILAFVFKQQIGQSGIFNYATDWTGFKWG
jgi:hypothetical protein